MKSTQQKTWTESLAKSWARWTPPDRPSPGELRVYEDELQRILEKKKKPNVMALGSTSEFRDLYAKYKLPCTVVEYRQENYDALGLLMPRKKYKETLLVADWRTCQTKQKYDLILGDYCINVIPKKDQAVFIGNLSRMLSPSGMCMIKTFVRYNNERGDLQKSAQFFYKKMKHRPVLETLMAPMFKSAYDYSKEEFAFPDVWRNLQALYRKKKLKKRELDYFASLGLDQISLKVYIPLFQDIIKMIEAHATLYGVRFGGEWFSVDVPIIMFKK